MKCFQIGTNYFIHTGCSKKNATMLKNWLFLNQDSDDYIFQQDGVPPFFIGRFAKFWIVCSLSGGSDAMGPMTIRCSVGHPGPRTWHPALVGPCERFCLRDTIAQEFAGDAKSNYGCFGRNNNGYVAASLRRNGLWAGCVPCDARCTYWRIVTNRCETWEVFLCFEIH
jgi:hypothetical protein